MVQMLLGAIKFSDSTFRLAEMKTIVALIFWEILTLAHLSSSMECKAMENIDSQRFFSGTWFVTHAKKGFSTILCREITLSKKDSTVESNTKGKVRERTTRKDYTVRCTGTENKGKVSFNCTREEGEGSVRKLEYNKEFLVAETDYDNYAVVCTNEAENDENILVINKNKDAADIPSASTSTLQNLGLNSEKLKTRKSYNCE